MDADIAVFDLIEIDAKATYQDPVQRATGFSCVHINGELTVYHERIRGLI